MVVAEAMNIDDLQTLFATQFPEVSEALLADGNEKSTLWAREFAGTSPADQPTQLSSSDGVPETPTFLAVVAQPNAAGTSAKSGTGH
jgi:hypothetical protein